MYDAVAGRVYGLARRITRNHALAEEVAQDVMVEICARRRSPMRSGSGIGWILMLAHRRSVDRVRRTSSSRARDARDAAIQPVGEPIDEQIVRDDERREVSAALDELTDLQREAVELAYYHGHTYREVAQVLDVPEGTAKSRLRRAAAAARDVGGPDMSEHELLPLYALGSLPDDERVAVRGASSAPAPSAVASWRPTSPRCRTSLPRSSCSAGQHALGRVGTHPRDAAGAVVRTARAGTQAATRATGRDPATLVGVGGSGAAVRAGRGHCDRSGAVEPHRRARAAHRADPGDRRVGARARPPTDAELVSFDTELSGDLRVAVAPSLCAGVVLGDDLEASPADSVYQLWLLEDGRPRSAGLIAERDGVLGEVSQVQGAQAVAISVEPPSGSDAPTGPIVAQADISG